MVILTRGVVPFLPTWQFQSWHMHVKMAGVWLCVLLGALSISQLADAFYLPGLAPTNFCGRDKDVTNKKKCKVSD